MEHILRYRVECFRSPVALATAPWKFQVEAFGHFKEVTWSNVLKTVVYEGHERIKVSALHLDLFAREVDV